MQTSPASRRTVVELFDQEFTSLIESLRALSKSLSADLLYKPTAALTIGENLLKSAGVVEQTFGGITTNLWDDPFEWTLPETLSTPEHVLEYLSEVEAVKKRAFASFVDDQTLLKYISVSSGDSCRLLELLLQTLMRASEYRGRAVATLKILSDVNAPGFII
jgi:hypothetical protein